jgi:hypothetical protein
MNYGKNCEQLKIQYENLKNAFEEFKIELEKSLKTRDFTQTRKLEEQIKRILKEFEVLKLIKANKPIYEEIRKGIFDNDHKLTYLTPEIAELLAKRQGGLNLDGLHTLSPEAAKHLARCQGYLYLGDLETLSPEAAKHLAQHQGVLWLNGLDTISPEAAQYLAQKTAETIFGPNKIKEIIDRYRK